MFVFSVTVQLAACCAKEETIRLAATMYVENLVLSAVVPYFLGNYSYNHTAGDAPRIFLIFGLCKCSSDGRAEAHSSRRKHRLLSFDQWDTVSPAYQMGTYYGFMMRLIHVSFHKNCEVLISHLLNLNGRAIAKHRRIPTKPKRQKNTPRKIGMTRLSHENAYMRACVFPQIDRRRRPATLSVLNSSFLVSGSWKEAKFIFVCFWVLRFCN